MTPTEVIAQYRTQSFKRRKREPRNPQRSNPADVQVARAFLKWCDDQLVDPAAFIDFRFAQLWEHHRRVPGFRQLRSPAIVPFAQRQEASDVAAKGLMPVFDQTVRDLTHILPGHEQVRRRYYLRQAQPLCEQNHMAGGYDPRSHFCPTCPRAASCSQQLNQKWGFNVVALRSGRLGDVPAAVQKALRGWDGSISV